MFRIPGHLSTFLVAFRPISRFLGGGVEGACETKGNDLSPDLHMAVYLAKHCVE
jgi:hypothetical protein